MTLFTVPLEQDRFPAAGGGPEPRKLRFLRLLAASTADLLEADDLPAALERLFLAIRAELRLDSFAHHSLDDMESDRLTLAAHAGLAEAEVESGPRDRISELVAQTRLPRIVSHVRQSSDPVDERARRTGLDAYACLPLIHRGKLLGTLAFGRCSPPGFDEEEIRFLTTLATYVALAGHRIGAIGALRLGIAERERLLAERLEMERQVVELTRMGALSAVAATIAHELNQPLSAATNYLSAIRLDPTQQAGAMRERAQAAEIQLQRAGEIIRRVRRMASHSDLTLETNALRPIIAEAVNLVGTARLERPPAFRIEIGDAAQHASLDRVQLVQILANLLRNAAEATIDAAEPLVVVQTRARSAEEVEIRVIDNGPGIPAEMQAALFQPRLGSAREGIGLGLAISRNLVEAHGGVIRMEDTPGGGATFCFTLPAATGG